MVASRVTIVRAPNPSPMTLSGTNTYLIDCGEALICIDPGPAMEEHVAAILAEAQGTRIAAICVTHGHPDHAQAASVLSAKTHAPIYGHRFARYARDRVLAEGEAVAVGDVQLESIEAPGHAADHLAFYERGENALFTGDTVLGSGFVVVAPPGGDMRAYQRTLKRLLEEYPQARTIYGGHGDPVNDPRAKLREYIAHRRARESQIIDRLRHGAQTIPQLIAAIYQETDPVLWPVAARQVLAHLLALEAEGKVRSRELARPMTASEAALLDPDWEPIVGQQEAETAKEEIGASLRLSALREYELVSA